MAALTAVLLLMQCTGDLRRERDIAAANTRAALDTTRTVLLDSVAAKTRLATQREVERDSVSRALDRALDDRGAVLRSLQRVSVAFDSLVNIDRTPDIDTVLVTPAGDSLRTAVYTYEGPPIEGEQVLTVAPRGGAIELETHLNVSPFTMTYGVACADKDAVVTFDSPEWVKATLDEGVVDPRVCNPPAPALALTLFKPDIGKALWGVVSFGLGYYLGSKSTASAEVIFVTPQRAPQLALLNIRF